MISVTIWNGSEKRDGKIEVSDLLKEDGIGVIVSIVSGLDSTAVQIDLLEAAELIAALTNAVRSQHDAMGANYVRP